MSLEELWVVEHCRGGQWHVDTLSASIKNNHKVLLEQGRNSGFEIVGLATSMDEAVKLSELLEEELRDQRPSTNVEG